MGRNERSCQSLINPIKGLQQAGSNVFLAWAPDGARDCACSNIASSHSDELFSKQIADLALIWRPYQLETA